MKKIFTIHYSLFTILCALALTSCRPTSEELLSYGHNDQQAFMAAGVSFAEEFKTFWYAMNENYGIWDYEAQCGVDWDAVYDTYLPQFEALDDRQEPVTDDELWTLYSQFVDSLHDGHMAIVIKNLHTNKYITLTPGMSRMMRERPDTYRNEETPTSLDEYLLPEMDARYRVKDFDGVGAATAIYDIIDSTAEQIIQAVDVYLAKIEAAGGPNETNDKIVEDVKELREFAVNVIVQLSTFPQWILEENLPNLALDYNRTIQNYMLVGEQIGVSLHPVDLTMANDLLGYIHYALFEGNIVYLRLGGFGLSPHLNPAEQTKDSTSGYFAYQQAVQRVWHHWFDTIQSLHASGQLGGVLLDVRNNGGGRVTDYRFFLGALLPSGGWESHTLRIKNGTGRYDYGPLTPFIVSTYPDEHEVIDDRPIVILANSHSVSLSENSTWGVKSQPNGYFIGTRTYGGLSALNPSPENYSDTYSGAFGVEGVTPIYGYIPKYICLYGEDLHPVESIGFEPDIEKPFDLNLWNTSGRDNQLEFALDFIRTK